ncbi:MAG: alpha/beta hydrolase [Actinobacteria bacterium]|nr:alpha/beta hydrolase [Actinomycetota bacterium]
MQIVRFDGSDVSVEASSSDSAETVVLLGGAPNSRLFQPPASIVEELDARLITFDRPGYGKSSSSPKTDWAASATRTTAILDDLNIDTCRFVGWSAGAGHAWHAASAMGTRCQGLTIVSGVCSIGDERLFKSLPADSAGRLKLLRRAPIALRRRMLRWVLTPTADRARSGPTDRIAEVVDRAGDHDTALLERRDDRAMLEADAEQAFAQGVEGWLTDALLMTQKWSADVADDLPLRVIHGRDDTEVTIESGEAIADLANVSVEEVAGGHYWMLDNWIAVLGLW